MTLIKTIKLFPVINEIKFRILEKNIIFSSNETIFNEKQDSYTKEINIRLLLHL